MTPDRDRDYPLPTPATRREDEGDVEDLEDPDLEDIEDVPDALPEPAAAWFGWHDDDAWDAGE